MTDISYATGGFNDRNLEDALDAIAAAGFPQAEILGQEPHVSAPLTGQALSDFRSRIAGRGLRAGSVHAPLGRTMLGAPDEEWRRQNVALIESYVRFAGDLGATDIVVHPVPNPADVPNADDPAMPGLIRDAAQRSLDELVPTAEATGVRITLENLPFECDFPFLTMEALRPLVDRYPAECVGLVIDIGHVGRLGMDPSAEIHAAGNRLWGTHLHDVDFGVPAGDHRIPTHGGLDWDAIRGALSDVDYSGPWTFEVIKPCHGESREDMARITREVASAWGM